MHLGTAIVVILLVGTFVHTARSERLERIIRRGLAAVGMTLEQAADAQDIAAAQWNRQLTAYLGQTPSAYRLAELPDDFQRERIKSEGSHYGLIVLERDEVGEALRMVSMQLGPRKKKVS